MQRTRKKWSVYCILKEGLITGGLKKIK
jgi:hypothetical protein